MGGSISESPYVFFLYMYLICSMRKGSNSNLLIFSSIRSRSLLPAIWVLPVSKLDVILIGFWWIFTKRRDRGGDQKDVEEILSPVKFVSMCSFLEEFPLSWRLLSILFFCYILVRVWQHWVAIECLKGVGNICRFLLFFYCFLHIIKYWCNFLSLSPCPTGFSLWYPSEKVTVRLLDIL